MQKPWFNHDTPDVLNLTDTDDGDGQQFMRIYSRKIGKSWEYAVVIYSDDGEIISWTKLIDGKGELIE